nr:immunoglobulin light chain junction region [Macaca mulatta]MPO09357.1 immunoglobulin light chain junction region [Macaca mulatta]MPO13879.1 immunoglobulin light chain junction region [Macaca mulatta]
CMSWHNNVYIF